MKAEHLNELCDILVHINNRNEAHGLLKDLLTPKELDSVVERVQIVKLLLRNVPQREISKELGVSIAKITRGSRALKFSRGGFRAFLAFPKWQQHMARVARESS